MKQSIESRFGHLFLSFSQEFFHRMAYTLFLFVIYAVDKNDLFLIFSCQFIVLLSIFAKHRNEQRRYWAIDCNSRMEIIYFFQKMRCSYKYNCNCPIFGFQIRNSMKKKKLQKSFCIWNAIKMWMRRRYWNRETYFINGHNSLFAISFPFTLRPMLPSNIGDFIWAGQTFCQVLWVYCILQMSSTRLNGQETFTSTVNMYRSPSHSHHRPDF